MNLNVVLSGLSALLSFAMALAVLDQWRTRHRFYQLVWTLGMAMFGIAALTEFVGELAGWSGLLYRTWYLTGAIWVAGWLGLGTVHLLARTRFGYAFAASLFLAGLFTLLTELAKQYPDAGPSALLYFLAAVVLALAIGWETYFGSERWVRLADLAVIGATVLSLVLMATATLAAPGYKLDPRDHIPVADLLPGYVRLLTPFLNITGAFALSLGALYSTYIFMPKRRVLAYSLEARRQSGDEFLFNLAISPIAFVVNFVASIPGTLVALVAGRLHSRVPATILIAIGGFIPSVTSGLVRFGDTSSFYVGQFLGALFLFVGFLASIEVFGEFRIPFTGRVLGRGARTERAPLADGAARPEHATS
ncbi:MAG TPA: hypothetical protein VF763_05500 [Candidatus Limnocylindrales bacterium]